MRRRARAVREPHWTPGGAAEAVTEAEAPGAEGEPEFSSVPSGAVAFALETADASARAASVAFQSTRMMVPSVAVVGYVSDDGANARRIGVRGYSVAGLVGPGASSLDMERVTERTSRGSLIVRFIRASRTWGVGRFDGTASGDAPSWALRRGGGGVPRRESRRGGD